MRPLSGRPLLFIATVGVAAILSGWSDAWAQTAPPLGASAQFGALGNSGVTGAAGAGVVVTGDVGSSPTATISNFPPSRTVPPFIVHGNDGVVAQAHSDMQIAYNNLAGQGPAMALGNNLAVVGALTAGIYSIGAPDLPAGTSLTLNGGGVFIFQVATTLTMNINSNVIGTANPCNIFWQVGTSATLNGNTFRGTVIADASITVGNAANVAGRVLAGRGATGAVVMSGNGGNSIGGCSSLAVVTPPPPGGTVSGCPSGVNGTPPSINTNMPDLILAPGATTIVPYLVSGSVIPNALRVSATSDDRGFIPPSAITVTQPSLSGEGLVTIVAGSTLGTANVLVTVTAPDGCTSTVSFRLTVGAAVPTLSEWSMIVLSLLLATAGFLAMRKRTALHQRAS